jgi:plasmid maintenance system killer protein
MEYTRSAFTGNRVDVSFRSTKLRKVCESQSDMIRGLGPQMAGKLAQRLAELLAADSLADLAVLPGARCHELHGERDGQLSLDLIHPRRLVIEPDQHPTPTKPDGGLDWPRVTAVVVVEIADTH